MNLTDNDNLMPPISLSLIRAFMDLSTLTKEDLELLLEETTLDVDILMQDSIELSYTQYSTILENIVFTLNKPGIIFSAIKKLSFTEFGMLGFALINSPDAGTSLEITHKFLQLQLPFINTRHHQDESHEYLYLDEARDTSTLGSLYIEIIFCTIDRYLHGLYGIDQGMHFECKYPKPAYFENIEIFFHFPIYYDKPDNKSVSRRDLHHVKFNNHDAQSLNLAIESCEKLLNLQGKHQDPLILQINNLLSHEINNMPLLSKMAEAMHLSARSLSRYLKQRGTSYTQVKADLRFRIASDYLLHKNNYSIDNIAEKLGYSETTNFIRDFKRIAKLTPRQYRKNHQS